MSERMNIPYDNKDMEGVRIVARKHIQELISEFVEKMFEIVGWGKPDSEIRIRLERLIEEYEARKIE